MAADCLFASPPPNWEVTTLGVLCARSGGNVQTGPFGSQLHASDYVPSGIPSIMPENLADDRISTEGIAYINQEDAERLSRYLVRPGDIVYSRRGDVTKRALVGEEHDGWLCGTGCLRVRFGSNEINPRFAFYYLGHPVVKEWISRHAIGATLPNLNTPILSALPFLAPPPGEQSAIAEVLGTLDDKIELNRRMNETLEAVARAIFKSWFVDFDPVHAKAEGRQPFGMDAETAALFPDSFEDSPLGRIPKGWKGGCLGEVAENLRRGVNPGEVSESIPYIGLEHMPRGSIALSDWGRSGEAASNKFQFREGEILFGKLRPYFHKVGVAVLDGVCSTDILVVRPRSDEWYGLVLCHVSSDEFVAYADAVSTGTRMPRTNWRDMARYEIALPDPRLARKFSNFAIAVAGKIRANVLELRTLAAIRDVLLPKLVSGEVRVTEAGVIPVARRA